MDNKQVTAEWIAQQRVHAKDAMALSEGFDSRTVNHLWAVCGTSLMEVIDALEASMQREAEKEKEIKRLIHDYATITKQLIDEKDRLTAERDAAARDLKWLSNEYKFCVTCKRDNGRGVWDCNDERCDAENHYEWRGPCAENAQEGSKDAALE